MKTKSEWIDAAARFQAEARSFVDGRFVSSPNAATLEHVNPATGLPQYALALADDDLLNRAVDVARRRFDDGAWSRCHPSKRREAFLKLAMLIEENCERLALCETLDTGKAIRDSFLRDVPGSATTLRWYAEAVDKIYGETAPVGPGVLATINLEPVGVVGAVIPWNFPIETAFWKVAPALILGNSVVLKPDEKSSRSALLAAALAVEAGIPEGVFNVVTGGAELGRAMGLHPGIDALSFTGSTEVGKKFLEYSAHSNLKMISLECGGKSANVVFADTADLDRAASSAAAGIFFHQGQVCSANSRLLVEDKIADEFVERLRKEALAYSPGAPLDPETPAGTMIGTSHRDAVLAKIAGGKRDGGHVIGGVTKTVEGCDNFIEPTIVTGLTETSELVREEVFGPVLCVLPFNGEDAAIRMANDSPYALAASLWTGSFSRAHRVAARIRAGTVSVNAVDALDPALPFGGFKGSGFGRDLSLYALRNYAQPKAVWFDFRD
ncbi:aldehyde dehydrogenase family protein [Hyphomicrobium facile]|uniref:Gamma-glutamyl-gamma-aminobutyraldehyde dehydrogenase n=1 Tax=Hyphomicrobium facile TaxID=51670 RepID=A0A1I7MX39_9HYPH|nr:aldehyde dehydrogenase family protein [Hyphomicrobium facile]SFV26977.1 gamma-glutamyl-gamma-aminobutyraldehyde dehydrogenase [Hyphomicrobium facile]